MRHPFLPLLAVIIFSLPVALDAGDSSRHCRDGQAQPVILRPGTYEGTFEAGSTFRQNLEGFEMTATTTAKGKFTLKVSKRDAANGPGTVDESTITGELSITSSWNIPMPGFGSGAGQNGKGKATLALDGHVDRTTFDATGDLGVSGQNTVWSPYGGAKHGHASNNRVKLTFLATEGECLSARGMVSIDLLNTVAADWKKAGFTEELQQGKWQMTRTDDLSERMQKLRDELNQKAPEGIVRTRDREGQRLGQIADRIKSDAPKEERDCLLEIWIHHVRDQTEAWAAEDIQMLNHNSAQGDWPAIQSQVRRALDTDRALSLVGLDECSQAVHERLWDAIRGLVSAYLKREVEGMASPERILDVLRQAELLGTISPPLADQTAQVLKEEGRAAADRTFEEFLNAFKAAGGSIKNPAAGQAFERALRAERAANLLGVNENRAANMASQFMPPPKP